MMYDWATPTMYGPLHWLVFAAIVALIVYPVGTILRRIGFSPFWSVVVCVPMLNVLGLWILALADWPTQLNKQQNPK
jgi:predicted PurR-regulated permease PerM